MHVRSRPDGRSSEVCAYGAVVAGSKGGNPAEWPRIQMGSTRMRPARHLSAFAGLALAALLGFGWSTPAQAQGAVRSTHGDWQIRCDTPPGAQAEQCALIQSVVAEDRSNA